MCSSDLLLPIPTVCPTDGTKITCLRTYANPSRHAGLVNGLHEHLVQAAQIGSAELGGEAGDAKPTFRYTINGTPILPLRGAAGEIEWDLDQIVALHGANGARQDLELGLILTNASDAAIDLFVAILYATEGDRTTAANLLRALRAKAAFA